MEVEEELFARSQEVPLQEVQSVEKSGVQQVTAVDQGTRPPRPVCRVWILALALQIPQASHSKQEDQF